MDEHEIDRILLSEETLVPSSGFESRVMDAVRDAAVAVPPLPFPWARFAVGMVTCGIAAAGGSRLGQAIDPESVRQLAAVAPELTATTVLMLAALGALYVPRILRNE